MKLRNERIFQSSILNFISHPFISQSSSSLAIGQWTSVISDLKRFPECQINTSTARRRMLALRQRCDPVIHEPRRSTPHHHIPVFHRNPHGPLASLQPPKEEHRR